MLIHCCRLRNNTIVSLIIYIMSILLGEMFTKPVEKQNETTTVGTNSIDNNIRTQWEIIWINIFNFDY